MNKLNQQYVANKHAYTILNCCTNKRFNKINVLSLKKKQYNMQGGGCGSTATHDDDNGSCCGKSYE